MVLKFRTPRYSARPLQARSSGDRASSVLRESAARSTARGPLGGLRSRPFLRPLASIRRALSPSNGGVLGYLSRP
eukprot:7406279-Alexandrium_andersonii.AAC.1